MQGKDQKINKRITVFTPAYNRADLLPRLYHSLKAQTFRDFEWVVVDDGSTDSTSQLFTEIVEESSDFPVRYFKTENGGKHRAVNRGVRESRGELFFIVDSDDYLPADALGKIDRIEKTIPPEEKSKFAGICGLKIYEDGRSLGTCQKQPVLDVTSLEREKYGISGDKAEAYYTEIMKKYPFPEFEGEKFITECVAWDRIAADGYLLRYTLDPLMICAYLPDGLSAGMQRLRAENPRGQGLYLSQRRKYGLLKEKEKQEAYLDFYYVQRGKLPMKTMAQYLGHNAFWLRCYLLWLRLRQKLSGG